MTHSYCSAYPDLGLSTQPILTVLLQPIDHITTWIVRSLADYSARTWSQQGHLLIVDQLTHTQRTI
jgi:hypothetical protein